MRINGIGHKMAGPKRARGREIAPLVRQGFLNALAALKKGGTISDISDIWQDILATDPARALELLAKYVPREMLIEQETTVRIISGEPMTVEEWSRQFEVRLAIEQDDADQDEHPPH